MSKKQSSQYDKIFKENIEAVIPALMQKVLGITAVQSEELPDDLLHTKERKPDVLKKVTDEWGEIFILQIECQPGRRCGVGRTRNGVPHGRVLHHVGTKV